MTDEHAASRIAHLLARSASDGPGASATGDWRSRITDDTVELTYGFPFPDSFPNDGLLAAAETLFDAEGDRALQYGGGDYADGLPAVIAARLSDRGLECHADEILPTNGAMNAIDVVSRAFLDPDDAVFLAGPTFVWSLAVMRTHGPELVDFPVDADGVDVTAVAEDLARRERDGHTLPTLFYTIPNFQNPTGTTLSLPRRERLLELAAEYDFAILEDDAYGALRYDGAPVPSLRSLDDTGRVLQAGTFSKTIAPGVRTGWIVADPPLIDRLGTGHTGGPSSFTRGLLTAYCREGYLEAALPDLRSAYRERRDHMLDCLDRHMPAAADWTTPDGGFFVWVELPSDVDTDAMLAAAIDEGVAYLPGGRFFPDDGGEHCLRLSFSHVSPEDMERGIAALARTVGHHLGSG